MALHRRFKRLTHCTSPINYKNVELLIHFVTESGRILPRRTTGMNAKQHRELTRAIKEPDILACCRLARLVLCAPMIEFRQNSYFPEDTQKSGESIRTGSWIFFVSPCAQVKVAALFLWQVLSPELIISGPTIQMS